MGLVRSGLEQIQFFLGQIFVQTTERCLHKVPANVRLGKNNVELCGRVIVGPTASDDVDWSDRTIEVTETTEQAVVKQERPHRRWRFVFIDFDRAEPSTTSFTVSKLKSNVVFRTPPSRHKTKMKIFKPNWEITIL
jgi:hypothetical protein